MESPFFSFQVERHLPPKKETPVRKKPSAHFRKSAAAQHKKKEASDQEDQAEGEDGAGEDPVAEMEGEQDVEEEKEVQEEAGKEYQSVMKEYVAQHGRSAWLTSQERKECLMKMSDAELSKRRFKRPS